MPLRAPTLSLVFDKAANFDVTARLADDERLVSRTLLRVRFARKPRSEKAREAVHLNTFPAWSRHRGASPRMGTRTVAMVEIDTERAPDFESAAREAFPVAAVEIVDQWMAVHTEARPGRREKWTDLVDFLTPAQP